MKHHIEKEFTFKELLEFAFPTMIMMIFMSLYTIVDGFFVSRFVGAEALSAVNIVYPLISPVYNNITMRQSVMPFIMR